MCSTPLESSDVTDKYLWSANCKANIKIRGETLKFKHLLKATRDGCELWDEGQHLKYNLPLDSSVIDMLERDLCAKEPEIIRSRRGHRASTGFLGGITSTGFEGMDGGEVPWMLVAVTVKM